jgi:cytochrome c2
MLARIDCSTPQQQRQTQIFRCHTLSLILCVVAALLLQGTASALPQNVKLPLMLQECLGCHQQERHQPVARFPNGFGKWQDSQCYGCHQEISEVAANLAAGKNDKRYLSLPVSDERLKVLAEHPMPYLQAPRDMLQQGRTDVASLLQFLQRPHGRCEKPATTAGKTALTKTTASDSTTANTAAVCTAPAMMAYPSLTASDLQHFQRFISAATPEGNSNQGQQLFNAQCKSCHQHSNTSGYNSVALSLFAADWLQQYQHKAGNNYQLSAEESADLTAFFNNERSQKQQQLDKAVGALGSSWQHLKARQLAPPEIAYLWQHFWRDANCVHCHGIEGRAKNKFDTSEQGIKSYLKAGKGAQLYYRLKIRQLEQQHGIGAAVPGMPMTGAALPDPFINLVGGWLKAGCPDQQGLSHCVDL